MKFLLALITLLIFTSCLHTVKLSMFPKEKSLIDYSRIESAQATRNSNLKYGSKQEYYFEDDFNNTEELVINISKLMIQKEGFKLKLSNSDEDYLIFEKGLSSEAWKSMIGVYYDIDPNTNKIKVYLLYRMTQDITGSFNFNYAEVIGLRVQQSLAMAK